MCPQDLLGDFVSVLIATIGALLTIITVVYSLTYTKREYLKELSERKKNQEATPTPILDKKIMSAVRYIDKMNRVLKYSSMFFLGSIVLSLLSFGFGAKGFFDSNTVSIILIWVDLLFFATVCYYFIRLAISLRKDIDITPKVLN